MALNGHSAHFGLTYFHHKGLAGLLKTRGLILDLHPRAAGCSVLGHLEERFPQRFSTTGTSVQLLKPAVRGLRGQPALLYYLWFRADVRTHRIGPSVKHLRVALKPREFIKSR